MTFRIEMSEFCPLQLWQRQIKVGSGIATYISVPVVIRYTDWLRSHPFCVIGKYLARFDNFPDYFRDSFVPKWFGRTRQRELKMKRDGDGSLHELVSSLAGWISITHKKDFKELPLTRDTENVVTFVWIAPWALDEFQKCNFVELDTSFRALRPYVYCVPMAIRSNESFPLGILVGPSESIEFYNLFFHAMRSLIRDKGGDPNDLERKPYLSDEHPALVAVCSRMTHFFCLRHLIEKFGSHSFLGRLVKRLAFSSTQYAFLSHIEQCVDDMRELVARGELQFQDLRPFCDTFGLHITPGFDHSLNIEH
jgi:hypothetical protein